MIQGKKTKDRIRFAQITVNLKYVKNEILVKRFGATTS